MPSKSLLTALCAAGVLIFYFLILFLMPVYFTSVIFQHGEWLAKVIVYFSVMIMVGLGIKEYRIDLGIYQWLKKKFGVRIF